MYAMQFVQKLTIKLQKKKHPVFRPDAFLDCTMYLHANNVSLINFFYTFPIIGIATFVKVPFANIDVLFNICPYRYANSIGISCIEIHTVAFLLFYKNYFFIVIERFDIFLYHFSSIYHYENILSNIPFSKLKAQLLQYVE